MSVEAGDLWDQEVARREEQHEQPDLKDSIIATRRRMRREEMARMFEHVRHQPNVKAIGSTFSGLEDVDEHRGEPSADLERLQLSAQIDHGTENRLAAIMAKRHLIDGVPMDQVLARVHLSAYNSDEAMTAMLEAERVVHRVVFGGGPRRGNDLTRRGGLLDGRQRIVTDHHHLSLDYWEHGSHFKSRPAWHPMVGMTPPQRTVSNERGDKHGR